jgi:YihY family inner membrane protein
MFRKAIKKIRNINPKDILPTFWFYIKTLFRMFEKDYLFLLSSGIAFNIVLCFIPFVLILFTVVGIYIGYPETYKGLSHYLNQVIPLPQDIKANIIGELLDQARVISNNTFITGTIGIVGVMWTMSSLFSAMRDALLKIYKIEEGYNFFYGKIRDFILIFVTLALFIISTGVTSAVHVIQKFTLDLFGLGYEFHFARVMISIVIPFFTSLAMFYILFELVPNSKFPKKSSFFSAVIATIFFEISKFFFNLYIFNLANYSQVYGAYAVIVINLLWVYIISIIYITSAALGKIYLDRHNLKVIPAKIKKYGTKKIIQNNR